MEKRTITISLEQALDWYYGDSDVLKELALNAYSESELQEVIMYKAKDIYFGGPHISEDESKKVEAYINLLAIAKFFNKTWKRVPSNTGYFITKAYSAKTKSDEIKVLTHSVVMQAGVVYFKHYNDALKAVSILGEKINYLFN